ncbi:caspase domain-containing protein [Xylaria grammica]|nr:caspase domain-containing protein [Xylaria grammica]
MAATKSTSASLMLRPRENKWAVLIGVDYYISGKARPGVQIHSLQGCVEDIRQVGGFLRERFQVDESRIIQLTATRPGDDSGVPTEDPSKWPTYENIVHQLQKVTQQAETNDLVYIHYSGHGARALTIFDDLKGEGALDEALVPTDIACDGGRYIRDVEIAYLLEEMVKKGLIVTVVFDCCHSGGADRGDPAHHSGNSQVRGISTIDSNKLASDVSAFSHSELKTAVKDAKSAIGRKAGVADHWLLEGKGYTFLAACRAHEKALEDVCGGKRLGVFTHALLSVLEKHPRLTYHRVWELVAPKVRENNSRQTVVLGGEGNRIFYGSDDSEPFHTSSTITKVSLEGGVTTVKLNCGKAHGISVGMEFNVWPILCSDFSDSKRLGRLTVTAVDDVTAQAVVIEALATDQPIEVGCLALPRTAMSLQRPVRFISSEFPDEHGLQKMALDAAREALQEHGGALIPLADKANHEGAFQVKVEAGIYDIQDSNGQRLRYSLPPLPIDSPHAARKLVHRLTHLARYYNVLELRNLTGASLISVNVSKKPFAFPEAARMSTEPPRAPPTTQDCKAASGEWVLLRVENSSQFAVNITVLDLDSSWEITQIYPNCGIFETLEVGKTLHLPLNVQVPDGIAQLDIIDTFKVFATCEATSFQWLCLGHIDSGAPIYPESPSRGNALEIFETAVVGWGDWTRKGRPSPPLGWDVQHATINMEHV